MASWPPGCAWGYLDQPRHGGPVDRGDEPISGEKLRCSAYGADPQILGHVQRDNAAGIAAIVVGHAPVILGHGPRLLLIAAVRGKASAAEELLRQGVDANAPALL